MFVIAWTIGANISNKYVCGWCLYGLMVVTSVRTLIFLELSNFLMKPFDDKNIWVKF